VRCRELGVLVRVEADDEETPTETEAVGEPRQDGHRIVDLDEGVQEKDEVHAARGEVELGQIVLDEAHVGLAGETLPGDYKKPLVTIDERVALRARREELRHRAVPSANVENVAKQKKADEAARQGLPSAARRVMPLHLPGDGVGPG